LLSMKYNQKETMLHDICQFGDADLLKKAIDILGPEKLHQIRSELPPKAHASNPNLPQEQIDRFMKAENRLFDTFDYLVKRFNPDVNLSQQPEFQKRLDDFCLCLTALKNNARIPVKNDFQAKTAGFGVFSVNYGGTYNALRLFLENATQREQKEFSTYISALPSDTKGNSTPAGRTLAEHINRKLKELEPKSEVRAQPPLQDGGPVYAVTPSAPPEPSLVAAAHAGPPGGPATTTTNTTVTVGSMTVVPPEGAAPSAASATVTIRTRSPSKGRV
ncbi:MAG TPA: hypothetical protein VLJ15_06800, partial [Gammaproteobacteria bacterium]|nr:hypothetical protein [Gammaproteobacteria bacterium]